MKLSSLILSACTYGRKASGWCDPHQAPPLSLLSFEDQVRSRNYAAANANFVMLSWFCEQWK